MVRLSRADVAFELICAVVWVFGCLGFCSGGEVSQVLFLGFLVF